MALSRKNVSVARTNGRADIFRLAGLLGDDNLIRHEGLVSRIGSRAQPQERIVNCHLSQATLWRVRARAAKPWRNAAGVVRRAGATRMAPAAPVRIHLVRCGGSIAFQKPGSNRVTGPVMFIRSATRPGGAPVGVSFPDERSDFPHKRIFFPAPLKKFPVWWFRELALETRAMSGVLGC